MKTVVDTSVLIALGVPTHLDLLRKMWKVVFVPVAVVEEIRPALTFRPRLYTGPRCRPPVGRCSLVGIKLHKREAYGDTSPPRGARPGPSDWNENSCLRRPSAPTIFYRVRPLAVFPGPNIVLPLTTGCCRIIP